MRRHKSARLLQQFVDAHSVSNKRPTLRGLFYYNGEMSIQLERPRLDLLPSYFNFIEEMEKAGETIWDTFIPAPSEDHAHFVKRLIDAESIDPVRSVPETTYWATKADIVVGRISLRHKLSEKLQEFGGHIGYEVRPSMRNLGIAKEMLRLLLETQKAKSIGKLLLTCAPSNLASIKTILANGGIFEKVLFVERVNRETIYYWIVLE